MTSFAPSGQAVSRRISRPYSPARPRAAWTPPSTSLTDFSRSRHSPSPRASRLPCPTTRADCWSQLKSSRAKWQLCVRPQHADAHARGTTAATLWQLTYPSRHLQVPQTFRERSTKVQSTIFPPAGKLRQQGNSASSR